MYRIQRVVGVIMCKKDEIDFQSGTKIIGSEDNSNCSKTVNQVFIEKRAEAFLNALKKYPQKLGYGTRYFHPKFKYIKIIFNKKK